MRITAIGTVSVLLTAMAAPPVAGGSVGTEFGQVQAAVTADSLETRVWLDRGDEPVVEQGDEIRVYYRTSADAYATIFRVDTDGTISLLFPQHPDADPFVGGGRDYRLVLRDGPRWRVDDDPGVGYFFMVASDSPPDLSLFGFDAEDGWDLSGVGAAVYEDPYVAIDDYVAAVIPDWDVVPYALDFLTYNVGEDHDFPRFLCYDCHGFQSYSSWNPYDAACSSFQVVIWDDPYFYPSYRYSGRRVVVARPRAPRPRYGVTARVLGAPWRPIVRTRPAPLRATAVYKEALRPPRRAAPSPQRRPSRATPGKAVVPNRARTDTNRPTLRRREPARTPPARAGAGRADAGRRPAISRPPATTRRPTVVRPPSRSRPPVTSRAPARVRPPSASRPPARARRQPERAPATRNRPRPTPTRARSAPPPRRPPVRSGSTGGSRGRSGPPPRRRGRGG
jgi:hypothetical protein